MLTNTKHPYKKIYFLCMITMIILLNGCVNKDQNLSKKFSSNSTIISMTVTHSNKQNDSFQSDIILLDTKDNSTETITSVPYTSQYPLTYYSSKNNTVYYTACANDGHGDEVFSYNCNTKKTQQLTKNFFAINNLFVTKNGLFVNAVLRGNNEVVHPFFYDFKTKEITDLLEDDDFYVRSAGKNDDSSQILIAGHSNKVKNAIFDKGDIIGIDNYIYQYNLQSFNCTKILKKEHCYIDNVTKEKDTLIYRIRNQIFHPTYTTYIKNLKTGTERAINITNNEKIGDFVGLSNSELYYITTNYIGEDSSSNLCKINTNTGEESVIYQTQLKRAINNAQFVTW